MKKKRHLRTVMGVGALPEPQRTVTGLVTNKRKVRTAVGIAEPRDLSVHVPDEARETMDDSIRSPRFRKTVQIDGSEFTQSDTAEPGDDGASAGLMVDGLEILLVRTKQPDGSTFKIVEKQIIEFAETYAVDLGDGGVFVGDYVGNRRAIPDDYDQETFPVRSTWQIYLRDIDIDQDDYNKHELEGMDRVFNLDQCRALPEFGKTTDEPNSRPRLRTNPATIQVTMRSVPVRPELGADFDHPDHGVGTLVECSGNMDHWTATVEFAWGDTIEEGQDVRYSYIRPEAQRGKRRAWRTATVIAVEKRYVTVEYERGWDAAGEPIDDPTERFPKSRFRRKFKPINLYSSETFYEAFELEVPGYRLEVGSRSLTHDPRTHNERVYYDSGESRTAIAELFQQAAGSLTEFKPDRTRRRVKMGGASRKRKIQNGELVPPKVAERLARVRGPMREREVMEHLTMVCERKCGRPWISWRDAGLNASLDCPPPPPEPEPEPEPAPERAAQRCVARDGREPIAVDAADEIAADEINGNVTMF